MTTPRSLIATLSLLVVLGSPAAPARSDPGKGRPPRAGRSFPDFGLHDLTPRGRKFILSEHCGGAGELVRDRRRAIVLDFFRTDCPPCRRSLKFVLGLGALYGAEGALVRVVAPQPARELRPFFRSENVDFASVLVARTHEVTEKLGVFAYPTVVVLDSRCRVKLVLGNDPSGKKLSPRAAERHREREHRRLKAAVKTLVHKPTTRR